MMHAISPRRRSRKQQGVHGAVIALTMLALVLGSAIANARENRLVASGIRGAGSFGKFEDVWQYAAVFNLRSPLKLRADRLELAVGAMSSPSDTRVFVSLGPVWRFRSRTQALYLDLGFSPTLLSGSTFDGRDLGGIFHFTSSAALGVTFGARSQYDLALRLQHTSNGGLDDTNPGLDAIALDFTYALSTR